MAMKAKDFTMKVKVEDFILFQGINVESLIACSVKCVWMLADIYIAYD